MKMDGLKSVKKIQNLMRAHTHMHGRLLGTTGIEGMGELIDSNERDEIQKFRLQKVPKRNGGKKSSQQNVNECEYDLAGELNSMHALPSHFLVTCVCVVLV